MWQLQPDFQPELHAATLIFNIAKEKAKTTIYCYQLFGLKLKPSFFFQPETQDHSDEDPEKIFCFNVGGKRWILNNTVAGELKLNIHCRYYCMRRNFDRFPDTKLGELVSIYLYMISQIFYNL